MRSIATLRQLTRAAARSTTAQQVARRAVLSNARALTALQQPLASIHHQNRLFGTIGGNNDDGELFFEEGAEEEDYFVQYPPALTQIGQPAPTFTADTVHEGEITSLSLEQYRGKYVVLFFYPKDFTYVCPTEIIAFNDRAKEFEALNAQLIAVSVDSAESHLAWTKLARNKGGLGNMHIPLVSDLTKTISAKYGVLVPEIGIALRGLFIIDPNGVLQQMTVNNFPIGRSVDETLRLLQAIQFHEEHGEVCPANWKPGDKTIIADAKEAQKYFASLKDEEAEGDAKIKQVHTKKEFDDIVKSGKAVVAKFMAPWCGKCEKILPFVRELANEHEDVQFVKLDVSIPEIEKLKNELKVEVFPEFRFFKGGKPVGTPVSGYKKTPLKEAVNKL